MFSPIDFNNKIPLINIIIIRKLHIVFEIKSRSKPMICDHSGPLYYGVCYGVFSYKRVSEQIRKIFLLGFLTTGMKNFPVLHTRENNRNYLEQGGDYLE